MKFLCLGYYNPADFYADPEEKRRAVMEVCFAQCIPFRATGKVLEEEGLAGVKTAKCIRSKNGRQVVTDGPFIETKEQLGSFFVIEAENMDDAIKIASLHPGAMMGEEYGFGIEVRLIDDLAP
jgi:hypothetical protein